MRYFIVYKDKENKEKVYHLSSTLVVGRSTDSHIVVRLEGVSRRHCAFSLVESKVELKDLDSTNGTYLNGTRIREAVVRPGDRVVVGACTLWVLDENSGRADTAQPTQFLGQTTIETMLDAGQATLPDLPALETVRIAGDALQALFRLTEIVNAAEEPDVLLREALDLLIDLLDMDYGCAFHGGADPKDFPPRVTINRSGMPDYRPSRSVLKRVLEENVSVVAADRSAGSGLFKAPSLAGSETACIVCVPLRVSGRIRGALYLSSPKHRMPPGREVLQMVTAMATQVGLALENLDHLVRLKRDNEVFRSTAADPGDLVGSSQSMQKVRSLIERVAGTDATVLVLGESGTGKELAARALHRRSARNERPLVSINCGAIPESMVESELFGHERGAFTGADDLYTGKFELASEGTLFLDEVGELSAGTQAKLLRALEEKRFYRLGGETLLHVDVRIIAATNADLDKRVDKDEFRSDLLYRLKVFIIEMPPLRDHLEDLPELIEHFIGRFPGDRSFSVTDRGLTRLKAYSWPGNVRELRNVLEREMILADGSKLDMNNLNPPGPVKRTAPGPNASLREAEKAHIESVLRAAKWNKKAAAQILGIGRGTLYDKIKLYDIQEER